MNEIRFKTHWRQYGKGDVCGTFGLGVATTLVATGVAEWVVKDKAMDEPPMNRAVKRDKVKRKAWPTN